MHNLGFFIIAIALTAFTLKPVSPEGIYSQNSGDELHTIELKADKTYTENFTKTISSNGYPYKSDEGTWAPAGRMIILISSRKQGKEKYNVFKVENNVLFYMKEKSESRIVKDRKRKLVKIKQV